MRQLVYQVCYTRYHIWFYLWLIGSVLKHCKVPKYYEQDCRQIKGSMLKPERGGLKLKYKLQSQANIPAINKT